MAFVFFKLYSVRVLEVYLPDFAPVYLFLKEYLLLKPDNTKKKLLVTTT